MFCFIVARKENVLIFNVADVFYLIAIFVFDFTSSAVVAAAVSSFLSVDYFMTWSQQSFKSKMHFHFWHTSTRTFRDNGKGFFLSEKPASFHSLELWWQLSCDVWGTVWKTYFKCSKRLKNNLRRYGPMKNLKDACLVIYTGPNAAVL